MGEYRAFSNDGMWWWNGTDWMPTRAPDGRSAIWNGTQWVPGGGVMGVAALTVIAIGLGVGEVIWAFIVMGINMSGLCPTCTPLKPARATPTTVMLTPFTMSVLLRIPESAPK